MERWIGKVAIVTGASAGIGKAIAEALVKEGLIVAGLARRKEKLDKLAEELVNCKGVFHPIQADITNEKQVVEIIQYIANTLGPIHVLVNNAGIARDSPLSYGKTGTWKLIIDTNVIGLAIATRETLKNMYQKKVDGHIIHISSIAAHGLITNPNGISGSTKPTIASLAKSLNIELNHAKSKIKISCISPGYVQTEIMDIALKTSERIGFQGDADVVKTFPALEPGDVADSVLYVLGTPPNVHIQDIIIRPIGEFL